MNDLPDTNEHIKLDDHICFILYSTTRALTRAYAPILEKLGITYPQYLVIIALHECDRMSVKELGYKLFLDSGTLTPLLKRMEKSGLILRERCNNDERKVYVSLTKKGIELRSETYLMSNMIVELTGISYTKLDTLRNDIKNLLNNLHIIESGKRIF
jgi:DNA-binding MarR family transcriptional regulator